MTPNAKLVSICTSVVLLSTTLASCYYTQAINGQLEILSKREPIEEILQDPETSAGLKAKLESVLQMRTFASQELGLPDNKSYRTYVDLERPYVVWNVFAAPEFSVKPEQWCFAFIGCVSYRGYFDKQNAQRFANKLADDNFDVYVAGISAYSTLGWFHDPMLNTILRRPGSDVAALIFHELAHQVVYVRNDTPFNESFAVTVEREGVKRWLEHKGIRKDFERYRQRKRRRDEFVTLIMHTRKQLERLYASDKSAAAKRSVKAQAFADLRREYARLKRRWGGYQGYDKWLAQDLNNAHLASVGLYNQYVPAFRAILAEHNGDLQTFYKAVEELAKLGMDERIARLNALQASALAR